MIQPSSTPQSNTLAPVYDSLESSSTVINISVCADPVSRSIVIGLNPKPSDNATDFINIKCSYIDDFIDSAGKVDMDLTKPTLYLVITDLTGFFFFHASQSAMR